MTGIKTYKYSCYILFLDSWKNTDMYLMHVNSSLLKKGINYNSFFFVIK